jgi:hypothetical protein
MKSTARLMCLVAAIVLAACVQQPLYTLPYSNAAPVALATPLPVSLSVTYSKDGKRDAKREQELVAQLGAALSAGQTFKPVADADAAGKLTIQVEDNSTTKHVSFLGTLSAMLGRVFIGQADFTPQGRRSARALDVDIGYTPNGGSAQTQAYTTALVTVTNNTQEPTDLVPVQDRPHAELALIGNDLNLFAANMAKPQGSSTQP